MVQILRQRRGVLPSRKSYLSFPSLMILSTASIAFLYVISWRLYFSAENYNNGSNLFFGLSTETSSGTTSPISTSTATNGAVLSTNHSDSQIGSKSSTSPEEPFQNTKNQHHVLPESNDDEEEDDDDDYNNTDDNNNNNDDDDDETTGNDGTPYRTLGTLQCDRFSGGPIDPNSDSIKDIVYWYDIPSDAKYVNPFQKIIAEEKGGDEKYFLFEHDEAGWNNCRMSFENVIVLAIATGRTIVLPPRQPINLFRKQGKYTDRFSMDDIYDFEHIRKEFANAGIKVITMEEFLQRVALSGQLLHHTTNNVVFPPENRTNWEMNHYRLIKWLRKVVYSEPWDPYESFVYWPAEGRWKEGKREEIERLVLGKRTKYYDDYVGKPVPVNGTMEDRISEFRAGANKAHNEMVIYDGKIESQKVILFQTGSYESGRLLSPFYTFHFFEDWYQDLWSKRFVRDHLRYNDEIMCAAARIVENIKQKIRVKRGLQSNDKVEFHTMHIRRGDFKSQYEHTQIYAEEYFRISSSKLEPNSTIYIASDEKNRAFFGPFKKLHDIYFIEDFSDAVKDLNPNLLGMVEQVVAAQGKTFHGTQLSTFTAYINRLRGYYSIRDQSDGYDMGIIKSYVFSDDRQFTFDKYKPIRMPFWMKEFPAAWRDIDFGIPDVTPK